MAILEVKDCYFTYPDGDHRKVILDHINVSFEQGKCYTILGTSGSGKTTFLSLLAGLDKPENGEILYKEKSILEIGYESFRRNAVSIVFQAYNLIPYMTAQENVMVATAITDNPMPKDKKTYALELLNKVDIDENKAKRYIHRLSGGEQQRVAIARAIATNVDIILADEPTGNLDEKTGETIMDLFTQIAHQENKCVIIVTHSKKIANASDIILKLDSITHQFEITYNK